MHYHTISNRRHQLGESVVWDKYSQCLYWADLLEMRIYCHHTTSQTTKQWQFAETIGSFALACHGQSHHQATTHLLIALRSGLYLFDLASQSLQHFATPEGEPYPGTRFNDGKVGPDGCFYVGTMDEALHSPLGKLYCVYPSGKVEKIKDGFIVSNGLAWTKDGKTMAHSCSRLQKICYYDFDQDSHQISEDRVLATPSSEIGRPDGGAFDTAGGYWSAGVSSGYLNRFRGDGSLDKHIKLPMKAPTMPCFGGANMNTIFVSSLCHDFSEADFQVYPASGNVIAIQTDYRGVEVPRFRFQ